MNGEPFIPKDDAAILLLRDHDKLTWHVVGKMLGRSASSVYARYMKLHNPDPTVRRV